MKKIILSVFAVLAGSVAFAVDGWLEWVGDVKGGNWSEAANWKIQGTSSYSVSELLSKSTGYDLSKLTDGAVVTNDLTNLLVGGLHLYTPNVGTITLTSTNKTENVFPAADVAFYIAGGTTLEWQLDQSNKWDSKVQNHKLVIMDAQEGAGAGTGGTFHMNPKSTYDTYKQDLQPCGHTTVILGKNFYSTVSFITLYNNATLKLEKNITVAGINIWHTGCKVDLNGFNLTISSGEGGCATLGAGQLTGKGNLTWYGGWDWTAARDTSTVNLGGYAGLWTFIQGGMTFLEDFAYPSSLSLAVDGSSSLKMNSDATLYNLTGTGTTGGPRFAGDTTRTLTLTANEATNGTFSARIAGNANVVKDKAGYNLTLSGDNRYAGTTQVKAGTLTVKRPHLRRGLVRYWSFEDADNLTRDYSESERPFTQGNGSNPATQVVDGVGGGKAVHFEPTASSVCCLKAAAGTVPEWGFPIGSAPLSLSLWLRPQAMMNSMTFLWRHGDWNKEGGQFLLLSYDGGKSLQLCVDNWPSGSSGPNWPKMETPTLMNGEWHHVVVSYHDNTIEMWYDGELKKTQTGTHTLNIRNGTSVFLASDEAGKRYVGDMDEVCLWDHPLSAEEVAAEYSLGNRANTDPMQILPQPVCHYRFDDAADIGKDECGGASLVANSNVSTAPSLVTLTGGYGKQLKSDSSMRLAAANLPAKFPKGMVPFTVSLRLSSGSLNQDLTLLQFGDLSGLTPTTGFRLMNGNCPRTLGIYSGNYTKSSISFKYSNVFSSKEGSFTHVVIACNPLTGLLRIYRDGVLEKMIYDYSVTLGESDLLLNSDPTGTKINKTSLAYFDDLQIFDRELTPYEVRLLTASLETDSVGEVIPATSDVTVDAGATLKVDAPRATLKSVAGAGALSIGAMSQLAVGDFGGFTGTVSGKGALVVDKALPTGPTVTSDVVLGGGDIAVGDGTLVETTGRVLVANAGKLVFAEEPATVPYRVVLAKGSEVVLQGSLDGWTSNLPEGLYKVKFSTANGELVATVVNRGLILLVK